MKINLRPAPALGPVALWLTPAEHVAGLLMLLAAWVYPRQTG